MKKGWEIKRLCEVCTVIAGQSPEGSYYNTERKGLPFYQGKKEFTDKFIGEPTTWTSYVTKEAVKDDILMSVRAPVGPVNFATQKICIGRGLAAIRASEKINKDYLFYYLLFHESMLVRNTGAVFDSINKTQIENISIPLPPLSEQKRIVDMLDKAFAAIDQAIANTEKNLQNIKELFESYLEGVFDYEKNNWPQYSLKDITTKIGSGATPRGGQESYKDSGISLVRSMNVHDLEFRDTNLAFIDEKQAKELDGVTLQENDVLLNITGASVARCCVFPKAYLPARVNQHVSIIRLKKDIADARFLNFLLCSRQYKNKLLETGEQGSTRQAITKAQIESFNVTIPELKKQQAIVNQVDTLISQTQKLKKLYQNKLTDLEELKKSTLSKFLSVS